MHVGLNFLHHFLHRAGKLALVAAFVTGATLSPVGAVEEGNEDHWKDNLKESLFEDVVIEEGSELLTMEAPYRAMDPAVTPISIGALKPQTKDSYIKKITLVIDENPSPVAAVFHLGPENGLASLSTRVRINEYSFIRAIAETNDGKHYMVKKFVKASGGCSAPPLKDRDAAMARLGKMKMKFLDAGAEGQPDTAQLLISHPNYSGLQLDQVKGQMIPFHYVQNIEISQGERKVLSIESDFSLSQDPSIHFHFKDNGADEMKVVIKDTDGDVYEKSWKIPPRTESIAAGGN